jgi:hypothetical protein
MPERNRCRSGGGFLRLCRPLPQAEHSLQCFTSLAQHPLEPQQPEHLVDRCIEKMGYGMGYAGESEMFAPA